MKKDPKYDPMISWKHSECDYFLHAQKERVESTEMFYCINCEEQVSLSEAFQISNIKEGINFWKQHRGMSFILKINKEEDDL